MRIRPLIGIVMVNDGKYIYMGTTYNQTPQCAAGLLLHPFLILSHTGTIRFRVVVWGVHAMSSCCQPYHYQPSTMIYQHQPLLTILNHYQLFSLGSTLSVTNIYQPVSTINHHCISHAQPLPASPINHSQPFFFGDFLTTCKSLLDRCQRHSDTA